MQLTRRPRVKWAMINCQCCRYNNCKQRMSLTAMTLVQSFFASDADLFLLFYAGAASENGAWCFNDVVVGLWDVLQVWNQCREDSQNQTARLCIVIDA